MCVRGRHHWRGAQIVHDVEAELVQELELRGLDLRQDAVTVVVLQASEALVIGPHLNAEPLSYQNVGVFVERDLMRL